MKKKVAKTSKKSKYFENNCLQIFLWLFMSLLPVRAVKKSHMLARIYFISLKNVLKQT